MGFFNFFGDNEHRVFNYKPMYYDKEKEERMRRFRAVDGSMDKKDEDYVPGSYLHGLLIVAVLYFIAKFYQML